MKKLSRQKSLFLVCSLLFVLTMTISTNIAFADDTTNKLGWITENGKTRYYDTEDHFVSGMNTIDGKKYYFDSNGNLQYGILRIGKAYYYAYENGAIRTKKGLFWHEGNRYYAQKGGKLATSKMIKSGKYYYYFGSDAKSKTTRFKYRGTMITPSSKTGAITQKQYNLAVYGPYPYKRYVLIDISDQTLKYYVSGKVKLRSNVVTGGPGNRTPLGKFSLRGKYRNVTLRGPDYANFVKYWMPFIGGEYGIHDASWRSSFGGSIYKRNGSHGCVNMPRSKAAKLYNMVPVGARIIIRK